MYSHVDHRGNKAFLKQIFSVFLIFTLYLNSITAHASGLNGWTLSNPIAQGASVLYNGAKNVIINGKNVAKTSTALVTPVAKDVAKLLGKGVGGVALGFAVEQLLGAVDWVLDPANNSIRYKDGPSEITPTPPNYREYFGVIDFYGYPPSYTTDLNTAAKLTCTIEGGLYGYIYVSHTIQTSFTPGSNSKVTAMCNVKNSEGHNAKRSASFNYYYVASNPAKPETSDDTKSIPLDVVAQKVIDNANNGNTSAQDVTTAAAADIVNDAQNDSTKARPIVNQLEANAETATDESASAESKPKDPAKPETGSDLSIEFPVFCGWAPTVCEAATTVISFPITLTEWWATATQSISEAWATTKDYFKDDKENNNDDELPQITPVDIGSLDTGTFKASAGCPAPIQVPVKFGQGGNVEISYEPICQFARSWSFVAPLIGFLSGAMILVGVGRKGEDGEI